MISQDRRCGCAGQDSLSGSVELTSILLDESIYSVCARIAHNALAPPAATSSLLLGHPYGARHHDLLYGLSQLEAVYCGPQGALVLDEFTVRTRTVLGGVLSFLPPADRGLLIQTIRRPGAPFRPRRMLEVRGLMAGTVTALRRCPDCAISDCERLQFAYWHSVHQLPGVWVCPWHGRPLQWIPKPSPKANTWLVAHRPCADFQELNVSASQLDLLHRLAVGAVWCASQWSLGPAALPIMVRARLHAKGLLRQEGFATEAEQRRIHQHIAEPLARTTAPQLEVFRSADWVGKTLTCAEFSQPLRWAVLIASTLSKGECLQPAAQIDEDEDLTTTQLLRRAFLVAPSETLDRDYALAQERAPQTELFPDRRGPRRGLAPAGLYDALGQGWRLEKAGQCVGITTSQASIWVRKDKALATHWHVNIARLRTEKACACIEQHLRNDPLALRSQVIRAQVASVRALERYAPDLLERLLPCVHSRFAKQQTLTF